MGWLVVCLEETMSLLERLCSTALLFPSPVLWLLTWVVGPGLRWIAWLAEDMNGVGLVKYYHFSHYLMCTEYTSLTH